eukprot:CAMPEP_0170502110 /NCGR_PEP_ID=MMETSP0208-20121228/40507_1 /TAXON_ID=197538 /ORGANISM="Strombidium inclinatum, Strain S3" /LENGTH=103 /DNA_ID=CAMNT_0010781001 /DNA_START=119 /DNA_END=427 /DNA_ORIENTATION=+
MAEKNNDLYFRSKMADVLTYKWAAEASHSTSVTSVGETNEVEMTKTGPFSAEITDSEVIRHLESRILINLDISTVLAGRAVQTLKVTPAQFLLNPCARFFEVK